MTINLVNNKKYIGKRTYKGTNILEDTYLGSGTVVKKAVNKYGVDKFKKIIVAICDTEEDAYGYEKTLINQLKAVDNKEYYNLIGGHRSISKVNSNNVKIVMLDASTGKSIYNAPKKKRYNKIKRITDKVNRILNIRGR